MDLATDCRPIRHLPQSFVSLHPKKHVILKTRTKSDRANTAQRHPVGRSVGFRHLAGLGPAFSDARAGSFLLVLEFDPGKVSPFQAGSAAKKPDEFVILGNPKSLLC